MYKFAIATIIGLSLSATAIAKPSNGFAVLNGFYIGANDQVARYIFEGESSAKIGLGNACGFAGKLTQPNKSKLVFIYTNNYSNGTVYGCKISKHMKIKVLSQDSKGIANKLQISSVEKQKSGSDSEFTGTYELW